VSAPVPPPRAESLAARLGLWIGLATLVSLAAFGAVAYVVVRLEEAHELATGAPEDPAADARNEVLLALAVAAPVGLALAIGSARWLTARALAPVTHAVQVAAEITAERLDRRLPLPERHDELRTLVVALNGLLARLERAYETLSLFAADASHELRTPLAVVRSELEVALRRPRTVPEWEAAARTSLDELGRLGRLVDALLRLARADAVRPGAGPPVDLAPLVEEVLAQHAQRAAEASVRLTGPPLASDAAAPVAGDREALASALSNVVGNAIRYTARGTAVTVSLATGSGDTAAVVVDDAGPGLDPAELESIFRPFARGTAGRAAGAGAGASDASGLGLGLAIARRIVERHGGTLTAGSGPGGGARFMLTLPLARA